MTDQTDIEAATNRLAQALEALDAAVEYRLDAERDQARLADQLHALGNDRSRLASELDAQTARARALQTVTQEVAQRIDAVMEEIRSVLPPQALHAANGGNGTNGSNGTGA
jgi:chromosome segregation ATPase